MVHMHDGPLTGCAALTCAVQPQPVSAVSLPRAPGMPFSRHRGGFFFFGNCFYVLSRVHSIRHCAERTCAYLLYRSLTEPHHYNRGVVNHQYYHADAKPPPAERSNALARGEGRRRPDNRTGRRLHSAWEGQGEEGEIQYRSV